jgi:Skp family chaperone for outer membrane proteins
MINYKQFLFGIIFLLFSISLSNAKDKVSYIDIDYILSNTLAGKSLLVSLKKEEELKISKFKLNDENFTKEEKKILAKKNLISSDEFEKEMKSLQVKFQKYKQNKFNEIEELKKKRNKNILIFLNQINPIIEKFMTDNSIYMIIDKKNVFIASKEYDITNNLIELIDNQIKSITIE